MKSILPLFLLICLAPASSITDCTLQDFVGTWEGKVEYEGSELAQGPYEFILGEDSKSLFLAEKSGKKYELKVHGCDASHTIEEEGVTMLTTYTFTDGILKILSKADITGPDGKVIKVEMNGSMSKVE